MKKVLFAANAISSFHLFNEHNAEILMEAGYEVHLALNRETTGQFSAERAKACIEDWERRGAIVHHIPVARSPFDVSNLKAYRAMKKLLAEEHFDMIHCHNPVTSVVTRLAANKHRKKGTRVIYTAHGFFFLKGGELKNWLIFYPVEWFFSRMTDVLITINREDYQLAKRRFKKTKEIYRIDGVGIDYARFAECPADRLEERKKYGLTASDKVLLSVGELYPLKNHRTIIEAMAKIGDPDLHYVVAGPGPSKEELEALAKKLGLSDRVHLIGYVQDVAPLHRIADVFCHPSVRREGLPVALAEATASGLPCIVSGVRGNVDIIDGETNGLIRHYFDVDGFAEAIKTLMGDAEMCRAFSENAQKTAARFDHSRVVEDMRVIYQLEPQKESI